MEQAANIPPPIFTPMSREWPDLGGNFATDMNAASKWSRSRSWGTKGFGRFVRTEAKACSVHGTTHETLKRCLRTCARAYGWVYGEIGSRVSKFPPVSGGDFSKGTVVFPKALKIELINRYRSEIGEEAMAAPYGHAGFNAAMRAVDEAKMEAIWGRIPKLDWAGVEYPAGLTVRLPCGNLHGKPVRRHGRDGIVTDLEGFGVIALDGGALPVNVEACAYVEMAQWAMTWRIRFVYQGENRPDVEKLKEDVGPITVWNVARRVGGLTE